MNAGFYTNKFQYYNSNQHNSGQRISSNTSDTISFGGHFGAEQVENKVFPYLVHETAFFREPQSDNFVKNYIYGNMLNKDKIKIISAACSTGEEAVTYSMLLDNIKDKVEILGFDLSEKSIKQAKSRSYLLSRTTGISKIAREEMESAGCKDSYLVFEQQRELTEQETKNKKLFDEFFEPSTNKMHDRSSLLTKFCKRMFGGLLKHEKKYYKLKDGKADNCRFFRENIDNIDKITNDEKADIILFRNAMYHIVYDRCCEVQDQVSLKYNKSVVRELAQKIKNGLNDGGLVVFGEEEERQIPDTYPIIQNAMKELGFKPLNKTSEHVPNIWQKCKD